MKIFAIGQNYKEHNKELNNENPSEPVVFMKPDTAVLRNNKPFYLPDFSDEIHYETELIVKINKLGKSISEKFAYRYYDEIGLLKAIRIKDSNYRVYTEKEVNKLQHILILKTMGFDNKPSTLVVTP